uniref:Peptidase S1 domain-containing protein n=1 Tax=Anopheles coluzzii TaxID=1518534 RepID=A0A8W7PBN0_ANOCL
MDSALELIVGRNGTIVGFGLSEWDVVSEQLKQATIGVVDPYTCIASDRVVYGTHLTLEMFCGKGQNGVSACNGDSGGGMFFEVSGRWFVRGLVSFTPARGSSGLCDPLKYTVYTDVAKYVEWIKQYIDQRVLPVESDVLEVDYEEKLRLFNFGSCDETTSQCTYSTNIEDCMVFEQTRKIQRIIVHPKFGPNNSADYIALLELLSPADTSQPNVQPICMPVTPELRTNAKTNLSVVAIARRGLRQQNITVRFVEPVECTRQYAEQKIELKLEFKRMCAVQPSKREERFCYSLTEGVPIQEMKIFGGKEQYFLRGFELTGAACSTITPSIYNNIEAYVDWILYNMRQLFALLELLEPADLTNPHIQPICLPFMDGLHRNKPAEVIMTSYHNNFGIIHANKTLKITTYQHCQPRLLHAGQLISFVTEPLCAVESSDELKHESLYSKLGSPYQLTVPYAERPRYFLYGMHVDGSYILSRLHHGPYIFHKIEKADLAWIVDSVRENEQQSSFPSKIRSERVNLSY